MSARCYCDKCHTEHEPYLGCDSRDLKVVAVALLAKALASSRSDDVAAFDESWGRYKEAIGGAD